jgi:periplasmic protein TonB
MVMKKTKRPPGADLRKYYLINLETGFIITLVIMNILFRMHLDMGSEFAITRVEQEVISMEEIARTEQIQRPPPPPRPPSPRVVPNEEMIEDAYFDLSTDIDLDMALDIPSQPPSMPEVEELEAIDEREIFTIVEEMPVLLGGANAIYQHLRYPEIARRAGIEGRVIVQFIIDQEGNVVDPVVVRGIGGGCDEAALEAVSHLKFSPGRQRGRPVKVRYSLPIIFRLAS